MGPGRRARAVSSPKTEESSAQSTGQISVQTWVLGCSPRFKLLRSVWLLAAKGPGFEKNRLESRPSTSTGPSVGPTLAGDRL